jgi:hypothetical protein
MKKKMKIKRFNESISDEPIILYNNKGDVKLGSFKINQRGKSGSFFIKDISDVDWDKSTISYYNYLRGSTEWINIHPESLLRLTDEIKQMCYESDKKENYLKFTFYVDDKLAKLIHVNPKFKRVEEGGEIISYSDKFEY